MRSLGILLLCLTSFSVARAALPLKEQLAMAKEDGRTSSEIEIIRRMIDAGEATDELRIRLIELWFLVQDYDMAEASLRAWNQAPPEVVALTLSDVALYRDRKPDQAIVNLEAFLSKSPTSQAATHKLADLLWREDRSTRLVKFLQSSPLTSSDAHLLVRRALGQRDVGDYEMALKDAEAARQVDPENPTVVSTAPAFERLKTAIPKIRAADLVLSKNPKDLGALVARSYWRRFAGLSNDLSLRDAEAAFETHKDSRAALLSVALTSPLSKSEIRKRYAVIPDFPELDASQFAALVELDLAVHASPKKDEALVKRAYILSSRPAQYELALKDADAALELNPANTSAWIERIYALGKLKQINLAAAALHSLEALKPSAQGLSTALRYYADAEFEAGELMSALGTVNRSLELAPSAFAYKLRAAVYQRLSRTSEAQADLEKAAALDKSPTR